MAIVLFSILATLLIGGGIILLFAHKWDQLPRTTRAVLSFVPLLIGVALSFTAIIVGTAKVI